MRYARLYALAIILGIFLWDGYWLYPFRPPYGGQSWVIALAKGFEVQRQPLFIGDMVGLCALRLVIEIDLRLRRRTVNHGSAHRANKHASLGNFCLFFDCGALFRP